MHATDDEKQHAAGGGSGPAGGREGMSRRAFLEWMGAITALLGSEACTRGPLDSVIPYSRMPEDIVPGQPLYYATAMPFDGYGIGVLAESHLGRPTKLEGNALHPSSTGGSDPFLQASILDLYDPDRARTVTRGPNVSTWPQFVAALRQAIAGSLARGDTVAVLTPSVTSPTLAAQLKRLGATSPLFTWYQYQPVGRDNAREGTRLAFGAPLEARHDLARADVIVSLDEDFLFRSPARLKHARDFASRRRPDIDPEGMSRLYAIECSPSLTGAVADHRLPLPPSHVANYALALARALGLPYAEQRPLSPSHAAWIAAAAKDLAARGARSLVVAGESQPAWVHALAIAMNARLGAVGTTITFSTPVEASPVSHVASLRELCAAMQAGKVGAVVILGGNPVYDAPADLELPKVLAKVPFRASLGRYHDETAAACEWHVPEAHFLESWSDVRAHDGTVTILQPLIEPLYQGKSGHEVVAAMLGTSDAKSLDEVKGHWRAERGGTSFERDWRRWLHDGVVAGTALPAVATRTPARVVVPAAPEPQGVEVVFRPDPSAWDGRFTNNGWLQELPRTFTRVTWGNVALVHPETAKSWKAASGTVIEIAAHGRSVRAPLWTSPLMPEGAVCLTLGYGRKRAGRLGTDLGYDAYALRTSDAPWWTSGAVVTATRDAGDVVTTHGHQSMEGRNLARAAELAAFRKSPTLLASRPEQREGEPTIAYDPDLFPPHQDAKYAWGMAINLNTCIGCNACVIGCQAENNIPIVGREQVAREREMHWLRIDAYQEGEASPEVRFQPVPCMHCETAPCEVVCPVDATAHSHEGLNQMVYNRCVGTRYCSNNCPYKVRRFNFYNYTDPVPVLKLLRNPDVTVRSRGVMEKCTYCIQRINGARIEAEEEGRLVRDGEIRTACQQACPTSAIVFGNLKDPESEVSKLKRSPLDYALLGDLNTKPRTTYLGKIWNRNPELEA